MHVELAADRWIMRRFLVHNCLASFTRKLVKLDKKELASINFKYGLKRFEEVMQNENDAIMLILRGHLFTETLLESIILTKLPRGDRIIENASLTYNQKLVVVDSLDIAPDSVLSSLRNLNKLRNKCAHELNKDISITDVTRIGSSLGKKYTEFKLTQPNEPSDVINRVISYICGYLTGFTNKVEEIDLFNDNNGTDDA